MHTNDITLSPKTDNPEAGVETIRSSHQSGEKIEFQHDFGPNLASMIIKYGDSMVYHAAKGYLATMLRNTVYSAFHDKDKDADQLPTVEDELENIIKNWQPKDPAQRKAQGVSLATAMAGMTEEERKAKVAEIMQDMENDS